MLNISNVIIPFAGLTHIDIAPQISLISGIIASLINIIVFSSKNLREAHHTYNCFLCMSIADFTNLSLVLFARYLWIYCQPSPFLCGSSMQYFTKFVDIATQDYLTSCLAIFSIFLEIFLTLQRYFLIINKKYLKDVTAIKIVPILAIISLIYYLPVFFNRVIANDEIFVISLNKTVIFHKYSTTEYGRSEAGRSILIFLSTVRIGSVMIILFILNIMTIFAFKKFMSKKSNIRNG